MTCEPLNLSGFPESRGRQQAEFSPHAISAVCAMVQKRLAAATGLLDRVETQLYLDDQWAFLNRYAPAHVAETEGLAAGYGVSAREIFTYLHLGILYNRLAAQDGCSTLAATHSEVGAFVAKNRDYGGDHRDLQRVFFHSDPASPSKQCLFVGSLGSPGAFSSGMNSAGLALVDTRVDWPVPGIGWLRYYLMTEILWRANTVDEAVALIESVPHAGGGSLALADASGAIASVEFGHPGADVQTSREGTFVHTNHYFANPEWRAIGQDPNSRSRRNSEARLKVLQAASARQTKQTTLQEVVDLFSSHAGGDASLCRHAEDGEQGTISAVIFCCETRELHFLDGPPCQNAVRRLRFQ